MRVIKAVLSFQALFLQPILLSSTVQQDPVSFSRLYVLPIFPLPDVLILHARVPLAPSAAQFLSAAFI